jgi:multidrug efflux pump
MVFEMTIILVDREILIGAPSSQWWTQLSSTIAGGLTFATMLTLVATPAMLVLGAKVPALFGNGARFFQRQPKSA